MKTYNNINGILTGRSEACIVPNQSIEFKDQLVNFDVIYSSTAKRCKDTLDLLPNNCLCQDIIFTDILLERSLGVLENIYRDEAKQKNSELFVDGKIRVDCVIPKGESISDVICRLQPLLHDILEVHNNNNILVCSHNQTLKIIYALINNISITNEYWHSCDFVPGVITTIL